MTSDSRTPPHFGFFSPMALTRSRTTRPGNPYRIPHAASSPVPPQTTGPGREDAKVPVIMGSPRKGNNLSGRRRGLRRRCGPPGDGGGPSSTAHLCNGACEGIRLVAGSAPVDRARREGGGMARPASAGSHGRRDDPVKRPVRQFVQKTIRSHPSPWMNERACKDTSMRMRADEKFLNIL